MIKFFIKFNFICTSSTDDLATLSFKNGNPFLEYLKDLLNALQRVMIGQPIPEISIFHHLELFKISTSTYRCTAQEVLLATPCTSLHPPIVTTKSADKWPCHVRFHMSWKQLNPTASRDDVMRTASRSISPLSLTLARTLALIRSLVGTVLDSRVPPRRQGSGSRSATWFPPPPPLEQTVTS